MLKGSCSVSGPPAVCEGPSFRTSSPTLDVICILDSRRPGRYEAIVHCGLDLHPPDG